MSTSAPESSVARTTIAPWLNVRNGADAIEFYKAAFSAVELFRLEGDNGSVVARLAVQGADFWLGDESPENSNFSPESLGGSSVRIVLAVQDPDAAFVQALAAGATEIWPVAYQYGWRVGRVVDPFGHHWEIGRSLTSPDVTFGQSVRGIRMLEEGETPLEPTITEHVLRSLGEEFRPSHSIKSKNPLTERETEVLRLLAGGYNNREIAEALNVVEGTVKNHVSSILTKLQVRDRTRAVLKALERGYL